MAGKRSQWVMVFCVNDVVHHYRTGRQGVVTGWERGHTHMWILFDDGEEKPRRKAAFNKGECPPWLLQTWPNQTWRK